ncbi:Gfo/Idh/MocA family protein [Geminisphaera colitermitum]|uniref:Gfo/Idh/MocA family protein n=1 Tax=Geminisphaera colitermitum TaxID=1148786 RepID=UPI000158D5B3|nr:Gfo/Idh/MocA family oxidoreductase [Geminisphaera colitermitum]
MNTTTPAPLLKALQVGVTNHARWVLAHANASTGFVLHALCDVNPAALAAARETTGLPESACYTSLDEALAKSSADCVIICTPTQFHVDMVISAVNAGLPVQVAKGMAPDWASAQRLAAYVQERKATAIVAQLMRYQSTEQTIRRALNDPSFEAYLGPVHQISYSEQRVRPLPRTLTYPFASVWDMSCHHFDNLLYWLGPIQEMTAHSWRAGWSAYPHDANTSAHIVFANGTRVHYLHTHDAARGTRDIELHGERGALFLSAGVLTFSARPTEQFGARPKVVIDQGPDQSHDNLLRAFHAYATTGVEPGISVRNNLETMAACELMVRSITENRTVTRAELDKTPATV